MKNRPLSSPWRQPAFSQKRRAKISGGGFFSRTARVFGAGILVLAAAFSLASCGSFPDFSRIDPGVPIVLGEFLLEIAEGEDGRTIIIRDWLSDKKQARIPAKIKKMPVTAVAEKAFSDKTALEEVILPISLRQVAPGAFDRSPSVKKIIVHSKSPHLLSIDGILYDKNSLNEIYYPAAKAGFNYKPRRQEGTAGYVLGVSGYTGEKARIVIPDKVEGYPVIRIEDRAFAGLGFLTQVGLPRYLESAGEDVFEKCSGLERFSLSRKNPRYTISEGDLYNAETGELVWYPEGQNYFKYDSVTVDEGGHAIITGAGTEKKKAAIPQKLNGLRVTDIADRAFEGNPALVEIVIPDSVLRMGLRTYASSPKLKKVTLGNGLRVIPQRAFYECTALREIGIPDQVTTISDNAFSDCTSLETVTLGAGTRSLQNSAFSGCSALREFLIPEAVSSIGENVFAGCKSLLNIMVDEKNRQFSSVDGVLFTKSKTTLIRFPEGRPGKQYTIPAGVEQIGTAAFSFCFSLSTIDLPPELTIIGKEAFFYCRALYNIRLGEGVLVIGDDAFSGCASLGEMLFPESLLSIGERAFASCNALKTVSVRRNVVSIGENAFRSCERLTSISLSRKTDLPPGALSGTKAEIVYID